MVTHTNILTATLANIKVSYTGQYFVRKSLKLIKEIFIGQNYDLYD